MIHSESPPASRVTGVILAGGRNSRMDGRHKALLPWRQRPFIAHIAERMREQVETVLVSSNRADLFAEFELPVIADPFADQRGPLAGMLAGLRASTTPLVLFAPCDNPRISLQLRVRLETAMRDSGADIAYAVTAAGDHYLYALMSVQLAASIERFLQGGSGAVRQWYAQHSSQRVDFDDQSSSFININSVEDLASLE